MALPRIFAALTAPLMSYLDEDFAVVGALGVLPCVITGTDTLALAPAATNPTIAAYANYLVFSGVAANTNTGTVTANVGGIGAKTVYKNGNTSPLVLAAGDIVAGNYLLLAYDTALNSAAGGFHLIGQSVSTIRLSGQTTVNNNAGTTLDAAALTGSGRGISFISRTGAPGAGFNDPTDTATNIVAAFAGVAIGAAFQFTVYNTTGQIQTITAGANVTLNGNMTTGTSVSHQFQGVVTATGTPAVSIYG